MQKIMVGMSGGVDSSAAALLLCREGYEVCGLTLRLKDDGAAEKDIADAAAVAEKLGIEHRVLDLREFFRQTVIADFADEYRSGRTPNPCIVCNNTVKFGKMLDYALEEGFDGIATGHYARIGRGAEGRTLLQKSESPKDQSYFLYGLTPFQLEHSLFPLEACESKEQIRLLCEKANLPTAHRGDSQEICFVPQDDYVAFLEGMGVAAAPGDFVNTRGEVIGRHGGLIRYTVGQRKGLGAFGKPMFVTALQPQTNTVVLGEEGSQYCRGLIADKPNWIAADSLPAELTAQVKIRYRAKPAPARITSLPDGRFQVMFFEPQRSVTPGQAAVIYEENTVFGGGRIIAQIP